MDFAKPKKIFIVDDDSMLTEALKDYLTRKVAHNVTSFLTGEDCLKKLAETPDVIILDYYLNTVQKDAANGIEILQAIRKHYPNIRVIMLSSQERYSIAMKTIQKGAEQYVIKDENAFEKIAQIIDAMS
ncbi:MAG: response regulator [Bacteroidetes bacterium]|nr:response regulator [Bacteroidota bacterium]MBK9047014.1 response regulator [Bacteroidota bacterium]